MARRQKSRSPPPPYSLTAQPDGVAPPGPSLKLYPLPTGTKPANFIHICTQDSIQGTYILDPGLVLPVPLVSHSSRPGDTKNVFIESQNGEINISLFVLPSPTLNQNKISVKLRSRFGFICARIHDVVPRKVWYTRKPLSISVDTFDNADVYIPHSFRGPLQLATSLHRGKVCYSEAVKTQVTTISTIDGDFRSTHKSFIGEYNLSDWKDGGRFWPGDELEVDAVGKINIYYDDEVPNEAPTMSISEGARGCVVV